MTDRKKPGVAFWATVALVAVLLGYPLSFGPACWITARRLRDKRPAHPAMLIYLPFGVILNSEKWPSRIVCRWATMNVPTGHAAVIPYRSTGLPIWLWRAP